MPKFLFLFFLLFHSILLAQTGKYPKDFFRNPLDLPVKLSGNFGELRDNHFHSGLDYKTLQQEGYNVYASADGYISRIKITQYGYGKAVYITHPNGYTSVYGHLQKFIPEIEKYVKNIQYERENYSIEVFPKPNELVLKKGEVFAFSGNTGSSGGPHLHFEIRDTDTQTPLNPLLFGLTVSDHVPPLVQKIFVYPLNEQSTVNQLNTPIQVNFTKNEDGFLITDPIYAWGKIGFAINSYDQQDGDTNYNGIYSVQVKKDDQTLFYWQMDQFTFDESRQINLHIDYGYYETNNSRLQKCFIEPANQLSIYDRTFPENGVINVNSEMSQQYDIIICDFDGNETRIKTTVFGKKTESSVLNTMENFNHSIKYNQPYTVQLDRLELFFPKNTFYSDQKLDIHQNPDKSVTIHKDIIPLTKNYILKYNLSNLDSDTRKHSFVARITGKGRLNYISSELKETQLIAKTNTLGQYIVTQDFKEPTVTPVNFKNEQWISNEKVLQVKISDDLSGIESFKATINNQWILMEWDHQNGILTYDFEDIKFEGSRHDFKIIVTDQTNNTKVFNATFYRVNP